MLMKNIAGHHLKNLRHEILSGIDNPLSRNPQEHYVISAGIADIVCEECDEYKSCFLEGDIGGPERMIYDIIMAQASGYPSGSVVSGTELINGLMRKNHRLDAAKEYLGMFRFMAHSFHNTPENQHFRILERQIPAAITFLYSILR